MDEVSAAGPGFESVPLPVLAPGQLTVARLGPVLRDWVSSAPVRALAEASGWDWPIAPDPRELVLRLAALSADWDFRGRDGGVERNFIGTEPADVNGRVVPEELIVSAARALGLVSVIPVPPERFTSLVVLSGLVRACVNRTRYARTLLDEGVRAGSVTVLGGHRELRGDELVLAKEQGFGDAFDEAEVVLAATRQAFGLGQPEECETAGPSRTDWDDELWLARARYRWPGVQVLIVPAGEPGRRVNTADQLRYWADQSGIGHDDHVLLLTTQIYVPFQQLSAMQMLGIERGCAIRCCGVDGQHSFLPGASFTGRSYLQEIRSALLAAARLMTAVREAEG
jgi:hypothetical protein